MDILYSASIFLENEWTLVYRWVGHLVPFSECSTVREVLNTVEEENLDCKQNQCVCHKRKRFPNWWKKGRSQSNFLHSSIFKKAKAKSAPQELLITTTSFGNKHNNDRLQGCLNTLKKGYNKKIHGIEKLKNLWFLHQQSQSHLPIYVKKQ